MSVESDIRDLEASMERNKESINLLNALRRLQENEDFKKVVLEDFFIQEAGRAAGLKADPAILMGGEAQVQMIDNIITAIGGLRQYFIKIERMGQSAKEEMAEHQKTHTELLEESAEVVV